MQAHIEDNIKMGLKEAIWEGVERIHVEIC
jgi:hypothetical protein